MSNVELFSENEVQTIANRSAVDNRKNYTNAFAEIIVFMLLYVFGISNKGGN